MSWRLGRAYSQDLRDKIMAAFDAGEPAREVAERFDVSVSYIYKADLRRRRTGDTAPGAQRNQVPLRAKLKQLVRKAKARSRDALWSRIGTIATQFAARECTNYLANSGYRWSE